eukprot:gnl/Chilomastix_caulleri/7394.p3 GENE.gnl/Chilomastix_caulleri/7394~~gnl/Chilomastix_caulleri/7394.p3  ORF type:complete len:74 (+),score=18.93 gnl/Chilomastix_caulleri/7394:122-343(+)
MGTHPIAPNTPLYSENIDFLSSLSIRGSPKISSSFEPLANKNNRSVNPVNLGEVQVDAPACLDGPLVSLLSLA